MTNAQFEQFGSLLGRTADRLRELGLYERADATDVVVVGFFEDLDGVGERYVPQHAQVSA